MRPDHAARASSRSRAATTSRTRWPRSRSGSCSASPRTRSGARPPRSRCRAPARTGRRLDGVRFVNDSQGTQPDAVVAALRAFDPPIVLIAGGRDKGVDLSELAPVVAERAAAAVLIGESGPALEPLFRARRPGRIEPAATLETRSRPRMRSPASASPPGPGRDRAAQPGRRELRHVRRLRRPRPGVQGVGRAARRRATRAAGGGKPTSADAAGPARRTSAIAAATDAVRPAKPRKDSLKPRAPPGRLHDLVIVVALTAVGILMVYRGRR